MQFLKDTQVEGRLFPQGARVRVINAGDSCLVLPDPEVGIAIMASLGNLAGFVSPFIIRQTAG